jgi:purine-binding chemotaxis protein CheW
VTSAGRGDATSAGRDDVGAAWEAIARGANGHPDGSLEPSERLHLITFSLAGASYAVRVESVREIVRMRPITPIPRVAAAVRGVISLRGEMVQVVDMRCRLGLPPAEPTRTSRIIVVRLDDGRVAGLFVDSVREVLRVARDAMLPASADAMAVDALCARGDEFVSLIALERVLDIDSGN